MAPVKQKPSSSGALAFMALLLLGLLLPMAGPAFVSAQLAREQAGYETVFGVARTQKIVARATNWFRSVFVDTGVVARSMSAGDSKEGANGGFLGLAPPVKRPTTAPPEQGAEPSVKGATPTTGASSQPSGASRFIRHWMGGFWSIVYFALVRLSACITTLPIVLALGVAILVEGETRRKLKWVMFGGSDPKRYMIGGMLALWGPLLAGLSFFVPGRLPPLTVSVLLIIGCLGYALWTANQQKPM